MKFYAVFQTDSFETNIFEEWKVAKKYIDDEKKISQKSFLNKPDAEKWLEKIKEIYKNEEIAEKIYQDFHLDSSCVTAATDGATVGKNPGPSGFGVFLSIPTDYDDKKTPEEINVQLPERQEVDISIEIGMSTNQVSEARAIVHAMEYVIDLNKERKQKIKTLNIFTDSLSCISWAAPALGWEIKANKELITKMKEMVNKTCPEQHNLKINLFKVRAHIGIDFNERADRLANAAAKISQKKRKRDDANEDDDDIDNKKTSKITII
jgi:ribonuclease HI